MHYSLHLQSPTTSFYGSKPNFTCRKDLDVSTWSAPLVHSPGDASEYLKANYCVRVRQRYPFNVTNFFLDLVDATIFQYLTANADRIPFQVYDGHSVVGNMMVMLDNGKTSVSSALSLSLSLALSLSPSLSVCHPSLWLSLSLSLSGWIGGWVWEGEECVLACICVCVCVQSVVLF